MNNNLNEVQPVETEWKPLKQDILREFEIRIKFLTIGCVIAVGCKEIPFTTIKEGMLALNEYINNPYETRQIWEKIFNQE